MEEKKDIFALVELMLRPCFCVRDGRIVHFNTAAKGLMVEEGTDIGTLLLTGQEEYRDYSDGQLYLTLSILSRLYGAAVTRLDGMDLFVLEPEEDDPTLQAMALAAMELRESLNGVILAAKALSSFDTPAEAEQSARMSRSLHRLLRLAGNMSDAGRIPAPDRQETVDIGPLFDEILEKAASLASSAGMKLCFHPLQEEVWMPADREILERAVLNILSNALKFTPKGGTVEASLTRKGCLLLFSVADSGSGMDESIRSSVFHRYLRAPGLEDPAFGLGLGLVMVRRAAASHGGTVLIDRSGNTGTRVTMTMAIRRSGIAELRSPIFRPDYTGGWDHALVELSDCLPAELYKEEL